MACTVFAISTEAEPVIGRERASTTESLSLIEQYEQLGLMGESNSFFVDLIGEEGSAIFSAETNEAGSKATAACIETCDLSTECSDDHVNIHVDIDEDDDDIFFSVHKCVQGPKDSSELEKVHVDLLALEEMPQGTELSKCNVEGENDVQCQEACEECEASQQGSPAVSMENVAAVEQSCAPVAVRAVVASSEQLPSEEKAPNLMAHLKGGRAQGVRNHLARKLSQTQES